MNPSPTSPRRGAIGLAAGGLLIALGGVAHPRVDKSLEFEQGLAGMFESSAWVASHLLTMAGFAVLVVSLAMLLRGFETPRLRVLGWLAAGGAAFAAVESLPHVLAATEATELRAGASTPLADLHTALQVVSTPVVGLSFAALALAGTRSRELDGGRIATAIAVLGGVAFACAGPVMAATHDPALSPLFAGSAGVAIWSVVAGMRTARRLGRGTAPVPPATATGQAA